MAESDREISGEILGVKLRELLFEHCTLKYDDKFIEETANIALSKLIEIAENVDHNEKHMLDKDQKRNALYSVCILRTLPYLAQLSASLGSSLSKLLDFEVVNLAKDQYSPEDIRSVIETIKHMKSYGGDSYKAAKKLTKKHHANGLRDQELIEISFQFLDEKIPRGARSRTGDISSVIKEYHLLRKNGISYEASCLLLSVQPIFWLKGKSDQKTVENYASYGQPIISFFKILDDFIDPIQAFLKSEKHSPAGFFEALIHVEELILIFDKSLRLEKSFFLNTIEFTADYFGRYILFRFMHELPEMCSTSRNVCKNNCKIECQRYKNDEAYISCNLTTAI